MSVVESLRCSLVAARLKLKNYLWFDDKLCNDIEYAIDCGKSKEDIRLLTETQDKCHNRILKMERKIRDIVSSMEKILYLSE